MDISIQLTGFRVEGAKLLLKSLGQIRQTVISWLTSGGISCCSKVVTCFWKMANPITVYSHFHLQERHGIKKIQELWKKKAEVGRTKRKNAFTTVIIFRRTSVLRRDRRSCLAPPTYVPVLLGLRPRAEAKTCSCCFTEFTTSSLYSAKNIHRSSTSVFLHSLPRIVPHI